MDCNLRCNSLTCREPIVEAAIVTTCSHIFCLHCGDGILTNQQSPQQFAAAKLSCPACDAELKSDGDIVKKYLEPKEDQKKTMLSGLNPGLIMEIAHRGLSFWAYQTYQEIIYQEYICKSLNDKTAELGSELENTINQANAQIASLNSQVAALSQDNQVLVSKNQKLGDSIREKTNKNLKLQEELERAKRKYLLSHVQSAAAATMDKTLSRPPGSSSGAARLSDMPTAPAAPMRQMQRHRADRNGNMQFAEGSRFTISNRGRNMEQQEGTASDGYSDGRGMRGDMQPPNMYPGTQIYAHGRVGSAGVHAWPAAASKEGMGQLVASSLGSHGHHSNTRNKTSSNNLIDLEHHIENTNSQNLGTPRFGANTRSIGGASRLAMHKLATNNGTPRPRSGVGNIQHPGSAARPGNQSNFFNGNMNNGGTYPR
ncbi:hypothetical protein DRE_00848 [Drechslerella stenobrocha 248]|uniref:RING-type domain-containing protein n=1 Tax=Drechslerella stenobrocha 248 TaxID=1043628 RepID=W7HQL7_9PEZI|nr:hypothetical protein DRE_00848 [Drechslerella stenobrocha 248]